MVFKRDDKIDIPSKDLISWYFDDTKISSDKPVYIDAVNPQRFYTHGQARSTIRKLVAGFRKIGLKKGDVVCLHSFSDINYPILVNGIVAFGGIYAGTNPAYQPYELNHAIKAASVKFLIVEPEILKHALKAADGAGISRENILILNNREDQVVPNGFKSWKSLLEHGEEDWERFDDVETSKNTTAARLFSSGTTGLPKAAMLSHYNLIAQHVQISEWRPKPYENGICVCVSFGLSTFRAGHGLLELLIAFDAKTRYQQSVLSCADNMKPRKISATPMFHVATAPTCHFSPLKDGVGTYVLRRFELEPFLKAIEQHQITDVPTVPPIVLAIIQSDLKDKYSLASVKFGTCGAAPLDKAQQARFKALLDKDAVYTQVWGMTETTCICTNFPYPEEDTTGSVGRPVPGVELKLVDTNDPTKDVTGYGVRGEVCIRGDTVIRGYLDEKATADSWDEDGYFHTGDIAYCDKETGKWYIVDRKKELIKVRGFQVAPPELESVLLEHPGIYDAAVIGVKKGGTDDEYPRAYIVKRLNDAAKKLNEKSVFDYMGENLAKFKRPEGGVVFIDEIPKNPSGKILKKVLREMAAKEMKTAKL